jgi:hypothetical protein
MKRDLAKQLKLAEFPIGAYRVGHKFYPMENDLSWTESARRRGIIINAYDLENRFQELRNGYYCPDLSDLIDACGHQFGRLYPVKNSWMAESGESEQVAIGDTPQEAVARLWLALHDLRVKQEAQSSRSNQKANLFGAS